MRKSSTKKKILVISLLIAMIAIVSMGSLAWFSASDSVENTLQFKKFSVDVYEHKTSDDMLTPDTILSESNSYVGILPGGRYSKDPFILNDGEYPEYVRATVTVSNYSFWKDVFDKAHSFGEATVNEIVLSLFYAEFQNDTGSNPGINRESAIFPWDSDLRTEDVTVNAEEDTMSVTFYYTKVLQPEEQTNAVFEKVTIPYWLTLEDLADHQIDTDTVLTITVKGEAIQSEFLPDSVTTCRDAFALLND